MLGNLEEDFYQKEEPEYEESIAERIKMRKQNQQSAKGLKILTPEQMLSRLPISLAQLKAGNNSEILKDEIRQLLYSLYRLKILSKKIFMNTLNSKTNESNKFIYQFTDKLNLKDPKRNMALANLSIYYTWKNIKSEYNNNKFKISAPTWNDAFDLPD